MFKKVGVEEKVALNYKWEHTCPAHITHKRRATWRDVGQKLVPREAEKVLAEKGRF